MEPFLICAFYIIGWYKSNWVLGLLHFLRCVLLGAEPELGVWLDRDHVTQGMACDLQ